VVFEKHSEVGVGQRRTAAVSAASGGAEHGSSAVIPVSDPSGFSDAGPPLLHPNVNACRSGSSAIWKSRSDWTDEQTTLEERYESSDEDEFEVERWETRDFQVREIAPRT
jgi:hypothetical protein